MQVIPIVLAHRMIQRKKPLETRRLKYKEKSYVFSMYKLDKIDVAKVSRIEGKTTFAIGNIKAGGGNMELHAESMDLTTLKTITASNPYLGVLSVARGKTSDTDAVRYVGLTSVAFDSPDDFDKAKLDTLRNATTNKIKVDSQRTKLYKWETSFFNVVDRQDSGWKKASISKLTKIAQKVLQYFKIPENKVHVDSKTTSSETRLGLTQTLRDDITSSTPNYSIVHVHDATTDTLIHELAHVIVSYRFPKTEASGHGPEFCGVYAHILGMFGRFDEDKVIESMQKAGLKVKPFTQSTKHKDI